MYTQMLLPICPSVKPKLIILTALTQCIYKILPLVIGLIQVKRWVVKKSAGVDKAEQICEGVHVSRESSGTSRPGNRYRDAIDEKDGSNVIQGMDIHHNSYSAPGAGGGEKGSRKRWEYV
jgi:hypothetical protein